MSKFFIFRFGHTILSPVCFRWWPSCISSVFFLLNFLAFCLEFIYVFLFIFKWEMKFPELCFSLYTLTTERQLNPHKTKSHRQLCNTRSKTICQAHNTTQHTIHCTRAFKLESNEISKKSEMQREKTERDKDKRWIKNKQTTTLMCLKKRLCCVCKCAAQQKQLIASYIHSTAYKRENQMTQTITVWARA